MSCGFCGKEIKEGEKVGEFWVVDDGRFIDICLECEERIKTL